MAYSLTIPLPSVPLLHRLAVLFGLRQRDSRVTWLVRWNGDDGEGWHSERISVPPYMRCMSIPNRPTRPDAVVRYEFKWAPND